MENYINKFNSFNKKIIYNFEMGNGGIGDCLKFFMYILNICINNNIRLYYKINNIGIEKYIRLKFKQMYITEEQIEKKININNEMEIFKINDEKDKYYIITPFIFYNTFTYDVIKLNIEDVFEFSDEIKLNSNKLLSKNILNYVSLHLRLGDKYLETDKSFVLCQNDERFFDENLIFNYIEKNSDKNILFFCDNNNYKLKIKTKYNNVFITNCEIGHTSLLNTTDKQTLDTITEFYLITNSDKIVCASYSGFSIIASKFKNVPLIKL